jgi:DNA-binding SARP family transcriptional activator
VLGGTSLITSIRGDGHADLPRQASRQSGFVPDTLRVRVNVVGPLQVVSFDGEVAAGPPKQRALLCLLVMHAEQVLSPGSIIDRLWGEHPPASAAANLQLYVSQLRRMLEPNRRRDEPPQILVTASGGYGLRTGAASPGALELDVRELDALLTRARELALSGHADRAVATLDEALGLWRGESYYDVRDEPWARPEIARLAEQRAAAVEQRAELLLTLGRSADVATSMEVLLAAEPLREAAWELLVRAYVAQGRNAEALDRLRTVRRLLAEDLGIDPGPALRDLETAILRQAVAAPHTSREHTTADSFVGRAAELATLERARRDALTGSAVLLLSGEPGVGKSALLTRFATAQSLWGRYPDHATPPPLWGWEQVIRAGGMLRPHVAVASSLTELLASGAETQDGGGGTRLRFFDDVVGYLASIAPVEVILDDIHAADEASLRLLEHVAAARISGLLLVVSFRSHETALLTATLARLAQVGARRVELDGLDEGDVRELVAQLRGTDPGPADAHRLAQRTGGNPFYVTELSRAGGELPAGVRDVVRDRIDRLGSEVVSVLEAAAVVGEDFETWMVVETGELSPEATALALDKAYRAGLVRESRSGRSNTFSHALVIDALLDGRSAAWLAVRHERCARALDRTAAGRPELLAARAGHWIAAVELGPDRAAAAAEACIQAAAVARARHAPEQAVMLCQQAVAAGELAGLDGRRRAELLLELARSLYANARYDEATAVAMDVLHQDHEPAFVVQVVDTMLADPQWISFSYDTDVRMIDHRLQEALAALPAGSSAWALGEACRGVLLGTGGGDGDIDAVTGGAVRAARAQGDPHLLVRAVQLRLIALRGPDFIAARADTARTLQSLPGLPPALALVAELNTVSHQVECGEVAAAVGRSVELEERAEELRDPTLLRQTRYVRVALAMFHGRYEEAAADLAAAVARTPTASRHYFQAAEAGIHAQLAYEQGALVALAPFLEQAHAETGMSSFAYGLGLALFDTEPRRARSLLLATPEPPRDYSWVTATVVRNHLAILLGELDHVRRCRELLATFRGGLVVTGTCLGIYGAYDGHLGEASLALGEHATARTELGAAVELLQRAGATYWLRRAREALARCDV